jgi:predicted acyltransferase
MQTPDTPATDPHAPEATAPSRRLGSIDAYRGLVMLLMLGEGLHLCSVARALPESGFWSFLCHHQSHVPWVGCSLHDLIQPSFSFLVGTALVFSIASRKARGSSFGGMFAHAVWRSLLLILLGVFLRSMSHSQTYWTFEDTLTQIGLGYTFLFLLGWRSMRDQWIALGLILVGYWVAFVLYPLPGAGFDYGAVGVAPDWLREHGHTGLAAHWQKNSNLAWAFDTWFLNLFPRESRFTHNGGGYATLSFIPTLGTMILGLIAGGWLRAEMTTAARLKRLLIAGVACLAAGWLLDTLGVCPNVKRIWTPSWVLFSGGWCFLLLAAFHAVIDVAGWSRWAFPLIVVGMNSIVAYCMEWLVAGFVGDSLKIHLGAEFFQLFGEAYARFFLGACVLLILWFILFWMYRRKLFLKI